MNPIHWGLAALPMWGYLTHAGYILASAAVAGLLVATWALVTR